MIIFTTIIKAIDPETGKLCKWQGPNIEGISFTDAQAYCNSNGLGYCKVDGILRELNDDGKLLCLDIEN